MELGRAAPAGRWQHHSHLPCCAPRQARSKPVKSIKAVNLNFMIMVAVTHTQGMSQMHESSETHLARAKYQPANALLNCTMIVLILDQTLEPCTLLIKTWVPLHIIKFGEIGHTGLVSKQILR